MRPFTPRPFTLPSPVCDFPPEDYSLDWGVQSCAMDIESRRPITCPKNKIEVLKRKRCSRRAIGAEGFTNEGLSLTSKQHISCLFDFGGMQTFLVYEIRYREHESQRTVDDAFATIMAAIVSTYL
jgi:hypothetical protein